MFLYLILPRKESWTHLTPPGENSSLNSQTWAATGSLTWLVFSTVLHRFPYNYWWNSDDSISVNDTEFTSYNTAHMQREVSGRRDIYLISFINYLCKYTQVVLDISTIKVFYEAVRHVGCCYTPAAGCQMFLLSLFYRTPLCRRPPTDRRHSRPQTTASSWNVTTVEERSAWSPKSWSGRWDCPEEPLHNFHFHNSDIAGRQSSVFVLHTEVWDVAAAEVRINRERLKLLLNYYY